MATELDEGPLGLEMTLHVLRNPWGHSEKVVRKARLEAADRLERLQEAYDDMSALAVSKDLHIITHEK